MRGAFAPTVAAIVALVKAQLAAAAAAGVRVAAVVAVGGFSASPFLVSELRAAVGRDLPVIRPPASGEAVLRGAVAFGLRPGVIASRVARKTYGLSAARPWAAADAGTALKQVRARTRLCGHLGHLGHLGHPRACL